MTRHFWLKLTLFLLPLVIPVAALTGTMVYVGESMPLAMVVATQQNSDIPIIYRPQYGNRDLPYKALSSDARQPDVLALGSSRVLQLRGGLLTQQPDAFYNAGAPAWQIPQLRALLEQLDHPPEVLIVGIDAPWFNAAYLGDESAGVTINPLNDFGQVFAVNRSVMQDVFAGRAPNWERVLTRQILPPDAPETGRGALGLKAIQNGHGFRADGSEQYGDFLIGKFLHAPSERDRHMEWMRRGEQMYVYGDADALSEAALAEWEALLAWCDGQGITVIGFMPPFSPTLYDRMMRRGNHGYIPALAARLDAMFEAHGDVFFDFSDGALFGTDDDFYDGWHGSERVYLRAYIAMLEAQPELLGAYSNLETLREIDANASDPWRVFGG